MAAESAGDLFDATEMDEILSLRILTLTEEEKREVRESDDRARRMRLGISSDELGRQIREDPTFRGLNGQFDQERFQEAIRQIGYTEQRFVAEKRRDNVRSQLISSLVGGVTAPARTAGTLSTPLAWHMRLARPTISPILAQNRILDCWF